MTERARVAVTVRELRPYSSVSVTAAERELVLGALTGGIERLEATDLDRRQTVDVVVDARAAVDDATDALELGVVDHDLVRSVLPDTPTGRRLDGRLREAEPTCAVCGERALRLVEFDGGDQHLVCRSCSDELVGATGASILEELHPDVPADAPITVRKGKPAPAPTPRDESSDESQQTTLDAFS